MSLEYSYLEDVTLKVCEMTRAIGGFLSEEVAHMKGDDVQIKGLHNFVTYVDKTAEERIIDGLFKILPEAGVIAEESAPDRKDTGLNWVIDPLDGTTNFIHGLPIFSISIALMDGDKVLSGVVYEVNLRECFYAWKGSPAFLNDHQIHVSNVLRIKDGLFATGFPYYDFSKMDAYIGIFRYLLENSHGVRRMGSAAVDLAYVACGRFEGFFEYGLNAWDVAAGALILKQAGGRVGDFSGAGNYIFGKEIVAMNGHIYDEFQDVIKKYFDHIII